MHICTHVQKGQQGPSVSLCCLYSHHSFSPAVDLDLDPLLHSNPLKPIVSKRNGKEEITEGVVAVIVFSLA